MFWFVGCLFLFFVGVVCCLWFVFVVVVFVVWLCVCFGLWLCVVSGQEIPYDIGINKVTGFLVQKSVLQKLIHHRLYL